MSRHLAVSLILPVAFAVATPFAQAQDNSADSPQQVALDPARGLRWELRRDSVFVYDIETGALRRRVPLPGATFSASRDSCLPGMILGRLGAVIVSSNVHPRLWRISPARFEVEVLDIEVGSEKEFGFSALAWGATEGTLYAAASPGRAKWLIDPAAGSAVEVDFPRMRLSCEGPPTAPTS
jgi:hypothetical protein